MYNSIERTCEQTGYKIKTDLMEPPWCSRSMVNIQPMHRAWPQVNRACYRERRGGREGGRERGREGEREAERGRKTARARKRCMQTQRYDCGEVDNSVSV